MQMVVHHARRPARRSAERASAASTGPTRSGRHRAKQDFLRRADRRCVLRSSRVFQRWTDGRVGLGTENSYGKPTDSKVKPLHNDVFLRRTDRNQGCTCSLKIR